MQTMRKTGTKYFLGVFALLLAGLLTGRGTTIRKTVRMDSGCRLRLAAGDYTAINPALYEHGDQCAAVRGADGRNEKNEVVPGLAEDWSSTKNLHLFHRMRLTFHDGEPLTSAD